MTLIAAALVGLIALLHVYILVLEMFLWTTPRAMKAFGTTPELAATTRVMAGNQGLYNGFLAAGLIWGLITGSAAIQLFFLACVAVAGLYGAATANRRILFIQTAPAALAALAVLLAR
jgi:putative membrane protein